MSRRPVALGGEIQSRSPCYTHTITAHRRATSARRALGCRMCMHVIKPGTDSVLNHGAYRRARGWTRKKGQGAGVVGVGGSGFRICPRFLADPVPWHGGPFRRQQRRASSKPSLGRAVIFDPPSHTMMEGQGGLRPSASKSHGVSSLGGVTTDEIVLSFGGGNRDWRMTRGR